MRLLILGLLSVTLVSCADSSAPAPESSTTDFFSAQDRGNGLDLDTPASESSEVRGDAQLEATVRFPFDESHLTDSAAETLDNLLQNIVIEGTAGLRINIVGHTDEIGTVEYNYALSQERAFVVRNYLIAKAQEDFGLYIPESAVSVSWVSELEPVTNGACNDIIDREEKIECLAPDRRTVVRATLDGVFIELF